MKNLEFVGNENGLIYLKLFARARVLSSIIFKRRNNQAVMIHDTIL